MATIIRQDDFNTFNETSSALPEQQQIVNILDEQFTVIDQNEKEIDHALTQSQALRQSILKKAFEGKLLFLANE